MKSAAGSRVWPGPTVAALSLLLAWAHPVRAASVLERLPADSALAVDWRAAGRTFAMESLLTRRTAEAEAQHDNRALARLLRMRGADLAARSQAPAALALLERSLRISEGMRDTGTLVRSLRWKAYAEGSLGRLEDQRRTSERQLRLARAIDDSSHEANALHSLGWSARRRGDWKSARALLEASLRGYRALGDDANEAFVSATLGSVYMSLGHIPLARRTYTRSLLLARQQKQAWAEAQALNDLGTLEKIAGDPARSTAYLRQAHASHLAQGALVEALLTLGNLVSNEIDQGHPDEAMVLCRQGLATADQNGLRAQRIWFLSSMAWLEQERGQKRRAAALWRAGLALGDTAWVEEQSWCHVGLARSLASLDSLPAALRELRDAMTRLEPRVSLHAALRLRLATAQTLLAAGQPAQAYDTALGRLAQAEAANAHRLATPLALVAARARVAMGRHEDASKLFVRAAEDWERSRSSTQDFGWREIQESAVVSELAAAQAELHLVHPATLSRGEREAAAFASLQRFKTRTLLERLSNPRAADPVTALRAPGLDLAMLQRQVLRDGELLIETSVGPDSSFLFAISRREMRLLRLPGQAELSRRLTLALGVLARAPRERDTRAAAQVTTALRHMLRLDEALAALPGSRAVIVSPDGLLHRAPFEALLAGTGVPVSRTPSASMLAAMRARPGRPAPAAMLVLGGGMGPGDPVLAGAAHETRWLAGRYRDARAREVDSTRIAFTPKELADFGVLHFAGHTRADDQYPWRSGITIRSAGRGHPAIELTAEEIAAQPMSADLVVLSSCESGGGRATSSEGLSGLSTAFLAAGSRTVVATLWPVDDAATARFIEHFYHRLQRGDAAGEALRSAQERMRRSPGTAHPFHWAGFVLTGDAETLPKLRPEAFPRDKWPDYLVGLCLLLTTLSGSIGLLALRRRASSRERV